MSDIRVTESHHTPRAKQAAAADGFTMVEMIMVLLLIGILITLVFAGGRILRGGVDDLSARETLEASEAALRAGLTAKGTRDLAALGSTPEEAAAAVVSMLDDRLDGSKVKALANMETVEAGTVGVWVGQDTDEGKVFLVSAGSETCYVAKHNPRLDAEDAGTEYATVRAADCGQTTAVSNISIEDGWVAALEAPGDEQG